MLEAIYARHASVVPTLALGVLQMKAEMVGQDRQMGKGNVDSLLTKCPFLSDFLNSFYSSRMSIRILISQHVALHFPKPGFIGTIDLKCSPLEVIQSAASDARRIAERELGVVPEIEVEVLRRVDQRRSVTSSSDDHPTMAMIPSFLHHAVFELIKNSLRATVEHQGQLGTITPIQISISWDENEYCFKISDQGGGIPRVAHPRLFSYLYSTYQPLSNQELIEKITANSMTDTVLAGLGYGLPIARLYMRFFGGDLVLQSMSGHSTDAFVYLPRHGNKDLFLD